MKTTKPVDQECLLLLYLPTLAVRVTVTCNNKKNTQTTVGFNFSFLFRFALDPPFFRFVSSAEPFFFFSFFVSPSSLFQVAGGMSKGRLAAEFLSCLHSCWRSVRMVGSAESREVRLDFGFSRVWGRSRRKREDLSVEDWKTVVNPEKKKYKKVVLN